MTSIYSDDEFLIGKAKRGRAGSLKPQRRGTCGSARREYTPQAIVKVAGWANSSSSVKRMLDYIARIEDKEERELVSLESEDGIQREGRAEVNEIFEEWKDDFHRKKQRGKTPRHAVHLVLSAKADLTGENVKKTLKAARRTVEKHFGDKGYKYALGVHQDGKSPHVHAVIKAVSSNNKTPKVRLNPKDLLEVRQLFAVELTREGLEHVASRAPSKSRVRHSRMKGKSPNTPIKVKAVLKNMEKELRQFERRMRRDEPTVNAFKFWRQQGKALETLRAQVKDDKVLNDKDRKDAFNLIRRFRRGIEKKEFDLQRELKATLNHFEGRYEKWKKAAEQDNEKSEGNHHSQVGKTLQKEIDHFCSKDLRRADLPVEVKKEAFGQMRKRGLEIRKVQEFFKGRER